MSDSGWRKKPIASCFFILALLLSSNLPAQQMHRWVDEDGQVHFSQTPPPDQGSTESEIVSYGQEDGRGVDRECCHELRGFSETMLVYMRRGLSDSALRETFPPSEYPAVNEVINFVGPASLSASSPQAIGARVLSACLNRAFQACRVQQPTGGRASSGNVIASSGSGVVVAPNLVLTNDHVVSGCQQIKLTDQQVAGRKIGGDSATDLALISTDLQQSEFVLFAPGSTARLGQDVVVAGFPFGDVLGSLNVTTGSVSADSGPRNNRSLFQVSAPVQPGNSGGPVLDSNGHLLGLVVSRMADLPTLEQYGSLPQNINFAISPFAIKRFLRAHDVSFQEASGGASQSTEAIASLARKHTVRIFCER